MTKIDTQATEHQEQAALIEWWKRAHPQFDRLLFAIPNGGLRDKITAAKLKAEGVKPGVADLFLAMPVNRVHGLFIEMKRRVGGRQSADQKLFQSEVQDQGYAYLLAYGWQSAATGIERYLNGQHLDVVKMEDLILGCDEEFLTVREVQILLHISRPSVYALLRSGQLEGVQINKRAWRVRRSSYEKFARRVN